MSEIFAPIKIGNVTLKNSLVLAPMAGYTDASMRQLCARAGVGLTVTEMVSAKGLVYSPDKCAPLLITSPDESVKCVQLFGHEPDYFYEALTSLPHLNDFDIIDINMGCPVPKIVKNGEGSALINNPSLAEEIVESTVRASKGRPVTVKTRLGFDEADDTSVEFCKRMVGAGASAITLHGRTRAQGYAGNADWDKIERLRDVLTVPVIGSGDVNDQNAIELSSRASALMIGRSAVGDPYIFSRILGNAENPPYYQLAIEHFDLMTEFYGERYAFTNFRHHVGGYLRGVRGQKDIKIALYSAPSHSAMRKILAGIGQN